MAQDVLQAGAPDPELKTSPIFDEYDEISLDSELEEGVCYFNNVPYRIGQYLRSGAELLHCEGRACGCAKARCLAASGRAIAKVLESIDT